MTRNNDSETSGQQTKIVAGGKEFLITLEDAQQMRRALETYLTKSRDEIAKTLPANLMDGLPHNVGEAWIDSANVVRMAPWLLEGRGDGLAMVYRPLPPGSFQYVARLEQANKSWKVKRLTFEKLSSKR